MLSLKRQLAVPLTGRSVQIASPHDPCLAKYDLYQFFLVPAAAQPSKKAGG